MTNWIKGPHQSYLEKIWILKLLHLWTPLHVNLSPFNVLPSFCLLLYFKIRLLFYLEFSLFFENFWPDKMHFGSLCKVFFSYNTITSINNQLFIMVNIFWNLKIYFFWFGPLFVFSYHCAPPPPLLCSSEARRCSLRPELHI